jgi:UDP-N-acetylmuramoyl-tripeptide--D-alanyl-D-alanine ligase
VVPVEAELLDPHLDGLPRLLRFGPGGDVEARERSAGPDYTEALIATADDEQRFRFPFGEAHNLTNALAAIAAGLALGASLEEMSGRASRIGFSRLRGERLELGGEIILVNDCYNANPVSMRAALEHLASLEAGRRVAVLGEMAELGPDAAEFHRQIGSLARSQGVDQLIGVGEAARDYDPDELVAEPEDAAELLAAQLGPGDVVLVKGSRSAGLERVAEALQELRDGEEPGDG